MYSEIFILQLYQCPNLSGTSLSMWVCVSWRLGKQRTDPPRSHKQDILHMHSPKKWTQKKTTTTMSWNWQANAYATANSQCDLRFDMSFVSMLTWPLSFIDIKCQASSTDSEDEEERLLYVRESQSHKQPYLTSQEEPGFFGLLVWVLVSVLSNQPLRNVELPADIPYLFSSKTTHFGSFPRL